ncbi:MAG: hypothetical protein C0429_02725 [Sphingopyxis sp.]|nr:hypothetical protein [Sphingopyxis sp.]
MPLRISRKHHDELLKLALAAGNQECCGLLLGRNDRLFDIVSCVNVADNPEQNFELDPVELLSRHKAVRRGGEPIIGYFHSHPNGLARPSETDVAQAVADGRYWLIIAADGVTAWKPLSEGARVIGFESIPILVEG